jgi:acetoin utilization protein AcuB
MKRPSPAVAEYTPRGPYAVGPKEPLANARRLMEKYTISALPVRAEGKLVGLLAERDLRLVWALMRPPPASLTVEDAMQTNPYSVPPDARLDDVVREMTSRHLDVAVVVDGGHVMGVFSAADAMRALVDMLEGKLERSSSSQSSRERSEPRARPSSHGRRPTR